MRYVVILFIVFLGVVTTVYTQQPPCATDQNSLTFEVPLNPVFAPLSSEMPLDVILGYHVLDSAIFHGSNELLDDFLSRQNTFNDTLKIIMKYFYKMVAYDPIFFWSVIDHWDDDYHILPNKLVQKVTDKLVSKTPHPFLDGILLKSDFIAHVRISDTTSRNDFLTNGDKFEMGIANCEILDIIKGENFFSCKDISISPMNQVKKYKNDWYLNQNPIDSGDCTQICYGLDWSREISEVVDYVPLDSNGRMIGKTLVDSNGVQWLKKGKEYIIFFQLMIICKTETNGYYSVWPVIMPSETRNMYPIENGFVLDPGNEFNWGTSIPVNVFKTNIKSRINEILAY